MIVVFCMGLLIGTVAGVFSWLAAAAFIEGKRQMEEGRVVGLAAGRELQRVSPDNALGLEERGSPVFGPRGRHRAPTIPAPNLRKEPTPRSMN